MRALVAAVLSTTVSVLPLYILGASAVLVREELHFGPTDLGLAIAAFFTAYGLTAWSAGQLSQSRGPRVGLLIGTTLSAVALLGIAVLVHDFVTLVAFVMIAGAGNAFSQVGGNLALGVGGGMRRQGLAFGLKQSAVPLSSVIAGAVVPAIGVTFGWRWSFVAALVLAPLLYVLLAQPFDVAASVQGKDDAPPTDWPMMIPVALAYGGAAGSASVLSTFLIPSAVSIGLAIAAAGGVLVVGSAISIATRLGVGMLVDRRGRADLSIVAVMLFLGSAGYLALAQPSFALFVVGALVTFGAGWGWNGAFNHAIVHMNRRDPGKASGLAMVGSALGCVLWPIAFGLIVTHAGFAAAWNATGALVLVSAILLTVTMYKIRTRAAAALGGS
jgi:MFS family permease